MSKDEEVDIKLVLAPEKSRAQQVREAQGITTKRRVAKRRKFGQVSIEVLSEEQTEAIRKYNTEYCRKARAMSPRERRLVTEQARREGTKPKVDSPRRCQAISKATGIQCTEWALKGQPTCHAHRKVAKVMPSFYRKVLGPTLQTLLEESTGIDPDEQVQIYEELALMRQFAADAAEGYSKAFTMHEVLKQQLAAGNESVQESHVDNAHKLLMTAGENMAKRLKQVTDVAKTAEAIADKAKDRFSIHDLHFIVERISAAVFTECGEENHQIAERIEANIRSGMIIPSKAQGTTLRSSDEVALELDDSVPFVAEEKESND